MAEQRFLNVREVAALTGVAVSSLNKWRMRADCGPPFLKLGARRVVYDLDDVLAWMAAQRRSSTKEGRADAA
jgi:predicted DNA-binding transcriptional regulator AlpA